VNCERSEQLSVSLILLGDEVPTTRADGPALPMVISTRIYVEHSDLALADTIRSLESGIGVVSDAGTDPQHDSYFFWIEDTDAEKVEAALGEDHTVAEFALVVADDTRRTYRIAYSDEARLITPAIHDVGGLTLESRSHQDGWLLELELPDREALYELGEYAAAEGMTFDVRELQELDRTDDRGAFGLTEPQVEALVAAFEHGYYEEPREITLDELAGLLDVSRTAVGGRLRRGEKHLVETILVEDERE